MIDEKIQQLYLKSARKRQFLYGKLLEENNRMRNAIEMVLSNTGISPSAEKCLLEALEGESNDSD